MSGQSRRKTELAGAGRHRGASSARRWWWYGLGAVLLAAVIAGSVALVTGANSTGRAGPPSAAAGLSSGASTRQSTSVSASRPIRPEASPSLQIPVSAPPTPTDVGKPTRLILNKIGVDTSLYPLRLLADGRLQSPPKWQQAGWFAGGVRPGNTGPAVIAGHVDSYLGPAVFYRLTALAVGDSVKVVTTGGRTLHFTVSQRQEFPKAAFPTDAVYGPTPLRELKLVTCTGDFDRAKRSYVDNLVITAVLDAPSAA